MKHYPSLIPYLIKRHTEIDPVTGEKIWDYTKEYHSTPLCSTTRSRGDMGDGGFDSPKILLSR